MRIPIGTTGAFLHRGGGFTHARVEEEQEVRAYQLERLGRHAYAARVRDCGRPEGVLAVRSCGLRCCPRCARAIEFENGAKAMGLIREMRRPLAGVFTFISTDLDDLSESLDALSTALSALRLAAPRFALRRFIGGLHVKRTEGGDRWNVHLHSAFEGKSEYNPRIATFWKRTTTGRGVFTWEPNRRRVLDVDAYARYLADSNDWCPATDNCSTAVLADVIAALHHRRLIVRWGFERQPSGLVWRVRGLPSLKA
jgi:hypothetical protein